MMEKAGRDGINRRFVLGLAGRFPVAGLVIQEPKKMKAAVVKDGDYCIYLRGRGNETFDIT